MQEKVVDKDKALLIMDFADRMMADAEQYVLAQLASGASGTDVGQTYRAALAFYQKLEQAVTEGQIAEKRLKALTGKEEKSINVSEE